MNGTAINKYFISDIIIIQLVEHCNCEQAVIFYYVLGPTKPESLDMPLSYIPSIILVVCYYLKCILSFIPYTYCSYVCIILTSTKYKSCV